MNRFRTAAAAAVLSCALVFGAAGTASAQDATPKFAKQVAVQGKNKGKNFSGTYTIRRFVASGDQLYAVGKLTGTLKNRRVSRSGVRMPVELQRHAAAGASQVPPIPTPGACTILDLVIQPIDLNLLGLRVATSEIALLVEAVPGAGNLLGNLLCGITGILDPQAGSTPSLLTRVLNALLALAPRTA
jgi:hypothetical protein